MNKCLIVLLLFFSFFKVGSSQNQAPSKIDVLVIGGGASGTMAGIQAARLGAKTLIVEENPWLGGMLTSAGVSAIDGNYKLHSGLWAEFRQRIWDYYGGPDKVKTGWVSNVLFEPSVGAKILDQMTRAEKKLSVLLNTKFQKIEKQGKIWKVWVGSGNNAALIEAKVVVDGTELGDIAKAVGAKYDIGMDDRAITGEAIAPEKANDIVQDLTYVMVLKEFPNQDKTIAKPAGYDASAFFCACKTGKCDTAKMTRTLWDCKKMLDYGKLPNNKYMINWPIFGNDYYLNIIELNEEERIEALKKAKNFSLCFLYFIQTELGFKHLGLADDEFSTPDGFPYIPYHRESRRIHGETRLTVNHLAKPYHQKEKFYRTGIAVGDYAVDHHHAAYAGTEQLPDLHFYPVPSYSIPMGSLIPKGIENFIVAEKSISVTNIVNGTTRLQPVCILIGQAAGALAAFSALNSQSPKNVPVRKVQQALLAAKTYLIPYIDVTPQHNYFLAAQRIGASGILKFTGKNAGWENQTLFYADSLVSTEEVISGFKEMIPGFETSISSKFLTTSESIRLITEVLQEISKKNKKQASKIGVKEQTDKIVKTYQMIDFSSERNIKRWEIAVLIDEIIKPFDYRNVDLNGFFK